MLKDERERQALLSADIRKAKSEQDKFIENMYNEDLSVTSDFKEEKKALEDHHRASIEESSSKFNAQSRALKEDFDKLIGERKLLNGEIARILSDYKRIDDDIAKQQLKLRYECNGKLLEVRKLLEEEQNRRKEKLSILDIINDDAGNIIS